MYVLSTGRQWRYIPKEPAATQHSEQLSLWTRARDRQDPMLCQRSQVAESNANRRKRTRIGYCPQACVQLFKRRKTRSSDKCKLILQSREQCRVNQEDHRQRILLTAIWPR